MGLLSVSVLVTIVANLPANGPLTCGPGRTIMDEYETAAFVVVGKCGKATRNDNDPTGAGGFTEFFIDRVLKQHPFLNGKHVKRTADGKTMFVLPRYVDGKKSYLVLCDVRNGEVDPFRGFEIQPNSNLVRYVEGAAKLLRSQKPDRLRHCYDYLNDPSVDVTADVHRELERAEYKDLRRMATELPPHPLSNRIVDPKTPAANLQLYSNLLGHCGGNMHSHFLRMVLEDPDRDEQVKSSLFVGYVLLEPKAGWDHVKKVLIDSRQEFLVRYGALRTLRFVHNDRPDLVAEAELVGTVAMVLDQPDMADFAIEDLCKWKCWELTDKVLALAGRPSHDINVVKRAILRFALQSPTARAAAFVRTERQRDAAWVKDTEELLALDE